MGSTVSLLVMLLGAHVASHSTRIDEAATQQALEVRVGVQARTWHISIRDGNDGGFVVELQRGRERPTRHEIRLAGTTNEQRSRELAAQLALIMERTPAPAPVRGWLALGGRAALGRPPTPDGGITVRGGAWWGRELLQPIGALGWSHARRGNLRADALRVGAGLGVGARLPGRSWWLGGSAVPQIQWLWARDRGRDRGVAFVAELAGLAQWRHISGVVAGLRAGVELTGPPLRLYGSDAELRFGAVRFMVGVELGLLFAPRRSVDLE